VLLAVRSADLEIGDARWLGVGDCEATVGGTRYPITLSLKAINDPVNVRIPDRPPVRAGSAAIRSQP